MYAQAHDTRLSKEDRQKASSEYTSNALKESSRKAEENTLNALINIADKLSGELDSAISSYAAYQSAISTRIQGGSSSFLAMETNLTNAVGVNPYLTTKDLMDNLKEMSDEGILYDLEQRAFLATVSENIATTFDASNSALLRIIRLQQSDSTAARLGMEAYMTRFLNGMYENTEYLSAAFDDVQSALLEASSLMTNEQSTAFEYSVQKWLGSLSSVGLSDKAANSIAQAIGYIGAGDISALNSNAEMQNLMVMAASRAGLDYSDMLINGLDESNTNALLKSMVEYLQEIASTDNNVVRSQYAGIFGLSVSDLVSTLNLTTADIAAVSESAMTYADDITELYAQMQQLPSRVSTAEMLENLWDNAIYGLGSNIAKNPALSAIWKVTSLIQDTTGGINIPFITAMGTGFDLNTTVENLIKLGVVGTSSLGMIGDVISGLGSTLAPSSMLRKLGITGDVTTTSRGSGLSKITSGKTTSSSAYVGNSSGSDIYEASLTSASDEASASVEAKQSEDETAASQSSVYEYILGDFSRQMGSLVAMVAGIGGSRISTAAALDAEAYDRGDYYNASNAILMKLGETVVSVSAGDETSRKAAQLESIQAIQADVSSLLAIAKAVSGANSLNVTVTNMPFYSAGGGV